MLTYRLAEVIGSLLFLLGVTIPGATHAQSLGICPGTLPISPNNTLPRVIFPIPPVVDQPWYVCYQNPRPCTVSYPLIPSGPNPQPHLAVIASVNGFDLNTQWIQSSSAICPDTAYLGATMPTISQAGPIRIRMFQRAASGIDNLPLFPFEQSFDETIQVRAPGAIVGVPSLDWRAMVSLMALIIGVAWLGRRS
jgi:hypothetical protein